MNSHYPVALMTRGWSVTRNFLYLILWGNVFLATLAGLSLMTLSKAHAGLLIPANAIGTCDSLVTLWNSPESGFEPGYSLTPSDNFLVQTSYSGVRDGVAYEGNVFFYNYQLYYPQGGWLPCQDYIVFEYTNDPDGSEIGEKKRQVLEEIKKQIRERQERKPWEPSQYLRNPADAGGKRAGLDGIFLTEASPDWFVLLLELDESDIEAGLSIPFLVEAKGDEDWLEFAVNNTVFFKQPLSEFLIGEWYEVDIPGEFLHGGLNSFSYFLNSAGEPNSSIFFPIAEAPPGTAPEPSTITLLGLGVLGVLWSMRRRRY